MSKKKIKKDEAKKRKGGGGGGDGGDGGVSHGSPNGRLGSGAGRRAADNGSPAMSADRSRGIMGDNGLAAAAAGRGRGGRGRGGGNHR